MTSLTKEEDFLEADQTIPGQKYVCLSFVSPEEILKKKDIFFNHKFLETIAKQYDLKHEDLIEKYKDFLYLNQEKLDSEFYQKNDFQTTVRGLKVRGSYDTLKEAQFRAKKLQSKDKSFNVYIGQVGFWLPWDPHPHKVENQEYMEGELNNLVKKYRENQQKKDLHFQENVDYAKEQSEIAVKKQDELKKENENEDSNKLEESLKNSIEEMDPWLKNKQNEK